MQYLLTNDHSIEFVVTEDITKDFGLHTHTSHYIVSYITQGGADLYNNNVNLALHQGDTFIIRPYMPHSVKVEKGAQIISLCINKNILSTETAESLCNIIKTKYTEANLNNAALSSLLEAITLIYNNLDNYLPSEIQAIADKIASMSTSPCSLDQLSEEVFVSKYHLIRKFKASTGLTPHQFLIQVRVRNAQKEIAKGNRLIDAALDNGFYDSSHFDKCFEKIVGISPSEYSKKSRGI